MREHIRKKASELAGIIRASLAMVIPVLFIGSITVLLNGFPVQQYQDFLNSFLGGALRSIIITVQYGTVGILAVYITAALNFSYLKQTGTGQRLVFEFGSLLGCLTGFFILVGFFSGDPDLSLLSGQGVFSAMIAGIAGSVLFRKFETCFVRQKMIFVDGADSEFNAALHMILPFLCVTLCFAASNYLITVCFQVQSLQHLFMRIMEMIFMRMQRSYSSGVLFILLTSIMWWFGIHGNNVLNQVAEDMFVTILPGEIVSKSFMDTFVNMGGTGCTIGLLLALILFGRHRSTKRLFGMAMVPGIFNIGEMMVFGFPVIYNPLMAIPFLLAPVLCFSNAYFLTAVRFVPLVSREVVWTTPSMMSGFLATGSLRGVAVQLLNILIATACYAPFVVLSEKKMQSEFSTEMKELVGILKKCEETTEEVVLTELEGRAGRLAKHLAVELEASMTASFGEGTSENTENPLRMKYQPQYDNTGKCIGAEALLRWEHGLYGTVYPPLVIRLARESGDLYDLETRIIEQSIRDSESFRRTFGDAFKLSVNVTVPTLYDEKFTAFLQTMADRYRLRTGNICIEITEETELVTSRETGELMERIRAFGYTFALDDFSMGHTSLQYLQHNQFDIVKLDGQLVRGILDNERTKEIISSIVYLSKSLDFRVLAEYVESGELRDALEAVGCLWYQGYLFGPAIDKEALLNRGKEKTNGGSGK
ncbi:MAG: EAL domain-containing protein [Lachnospiraceae bacterium]|nr:EAL domain-containing protein [Lachnospiraceae bacterium]